MTQHRDKHATVAHSPTTPAQGAVAASSDKDHQGRLVSDEDIRRCAYRKWVAAGKPGGDGIQFWLQAEQELGQATNEKDAQRGGGYGQPEHERAEPEKAVKGNVDSHYRDENRMFQSHGERGHRHGGSG
jgi:hypothetical protein